MRVLILNHEFPPLGGGAGRVCYELARNLVRAKHAVTVVTSNDRDTLPAHEKIEGIDVYRVYGRRRSPLDNNLPITMASYLISGTRLASRLLRQQTFDLIHTFFSVPAGLMGTWLKYRSGVPLIVSPHGSDVPHHNPEKLNLPVRMLAPIIANVWHRADRVVTVSNGLKQTAQRTAPDIGYEVIHNGIDLDHFQPANSRPPSSITKLVCVARLVELKGIHHLLKALAFLKKMGLPFSLKIAGEGNYRAELERLRVHLGIEKQVEFLGQVPYQNLPLLYHQSDLFVLPSLNESFGQTFAEAMACGLPIVGTTAGGIPEVTGPHQAPWLVEPGNPEALAEKLATLLRSSVWRDHLSQHNPAYIRQHFGWSRVTGAYEEMYAHVIDRYENQSEHVTLPHPARPQIVS